MLVQRDRALLHRQVFRVLKRQVQEGRFHWVKLLIDALINNNSSAFERRTVVGKGLRAVAVDVAGELIQHQDQGQAGTCADSPLIEISLQGGIG